MIHVTASLFFLALSYHKTVAPQDSMQTPQDTVLLPDLVNLITEDQSFQSYVNLLLSSPHYLSSPQVIIPAQVTRSVLCVNIKQAIDLCFELPSTKSLMMRHHLAKKLCQQVKSSADRNSCLAYLSEKYTQAQSLPTLHIEIKRPSLQADSFSSKRQQVKRRKFELKIEELRLLQRKLDLEIEEQELEFLHLPE